MKRLFKAQRALTLIELILSILLLNVVILTGFSLEMTIRRILLTVDRETLLMSEAAPILDMLTRTINRAIGDAGTLPYNTVSLGSFDPTLRLLVDSDYNAQADVDDRWTAFRWTSGGVGVRNQLWFYRNASDLTTYEILSNKVAGFSWSGPINNTMTINLVMRSNVSLGVSISNPQVTLTTAAHFREFTPN